MTVTIEKMYDETIRPLSAQERLQLARLILNNLPDSALIDDSDDWSDEDLRDATRYSLQRADALFGEKTDAA